MRLGWKKAMRTLAYSWTKKMPRSPRAVLKEGLRRRPEAGRRTVEALSWNRSVVGSDVALSHALWPASGAATPYIVFIRALCSPRGLSGREPRRRQVQRRRLSAGTIAFGGENGSGTNYRTTQPFSWPPSLPSARAALQHPTPS